jgi:aspartyl-tRNA(Asn)/glutamyl-tRNA(Gln) amidotransferase subunit A
MTADFFSLEAEPADYVGKLNAGIWGLRVAWSPNLGFVPVVDKQVSAITAKAARTFEELGCYVEEVSDTGFEDTLSIHVPLWLSGLAGMLGKYLPERESQMDPLLVSWIRIGLEISAADCGLQGRCLRLGRAERFTCGFSQLVTVQCHFQPDACTGRF